MIFIIVLISIIIVETLIIVILSIVLSNTLKKRGEKEIVEYNSKIIDREKQIAIVKKEHEEIHNEIQKANNLDEYIGIANKLQNNDNKD